MARGKLITMTQANQVATLYKEGKSIKEIMDKSGVKSEQTIYRILENLNIPLRPKINKVIQKSIAMETDTLNILNKLEKGNRSKFVNEAIRFYFDKKNEQ